MPNQPTCVGNLLSQCTPDGSSYLPNPVDCAATSQLCCEGACRSPSTYTIDAGLSQTASQDVVDDDGARLNVFQVSGGDAYLMGVSQGLTTAKQTTLGWYVYGSATKTTGLFTPLFQRNTTSTTTGYLQTSGPMCIKLKNQQYYAIGVGWQTRPATVTYFYGVTFPKASPLGPVVENHASDIFPSTTPQWRNPSAGSVYYQQLTFGR